MPIYDFRCNHCEWQFSELLPINANADCKNCGHEARKLFNGFAFQLNGSGWFEKE